MQTDTGVKNNPLRHGTLKTSTGHDTLLRGWKRLRNLLTLTDINLTVCYIPQTLENGTNYRTIYILPYANSLDMQMILNTTYLMVQSSCNCFFFVVKNAYTSLSECLFLQTSCTYSRRYVVNHDQGFHLRIICHSNVGSDPWDLAKKTWLDS